MTKVTKSERLVCSVCGSEDVQVRVWISPNKRSVKNEEMDFDPNEEEDCWCNECSEHVELVLKNEFTKKEP